jgi:hypothetical protein
MYIAEVQAKGQEDPVFTLTKPVPGSHPMCRAAAQPLVPYSDRVMPLCAKGTAVCPDTAAATRRLLLDEER